MLGATIVVLAVLRLFFVDMAAVGHNGMAPTLFAGDIVLSLRHATLARGDIAMCNHPNRSGQFAIGRIIGTEGDTVDKSKSGLQVNGTSLSVDIRENVTFTDTVTNTPRNLELADESLGNVTYSTFANRGYWRLPETNVHGFFLLGDNRSSHLEDSRTFGALPTETCKGQVFLRLRPGGNAPESLGHKWFDLL